MNNNDFPRLPAGKSPEPLKKLPLPPKSGKVSGFPTAPPVRPARPSSPAVTQPAKPYTPPARFPSTPTPPAAPAPAPTAATLSDDLDKIILSDAELQDVNEHRGARRVKFLSEERIYRIATSNDPVVRKELATNPDTPENILKILAQDGDEQVREEVVHNPSTPKEVLDLLVSDPSTWVIEALISNPRTPYATLKKIKLGNDPYLKNLMSKRGL